LGINKVSCIQCIANHAIVAKVNHKMILEFVMARLGRDDGTVLATREDGIKAD
jgi:hypothetical protein